VFKFFTKFDLNVWTTEWNKQSKAVLITKIASTSFLKERWCYTAIHKMQRRVESIKGFNTRVHNVYFKVEKKLKRIAGNSISDLFNCDSQGMTHPLISTSESKSPLKRNHSLENGQRCDGWVIDCKSKSMQKSFIQWLKTVSFSKADLFLFVKTKIFWRKGLSFFKKQRQWLQCIIWK